jgi:arginine/ornithine N-succinyltransferase beta subunit
MKKLVAMAIVAMSISGCAAMRAAAARDKFIQNATMGHTYNQPCGQIWAAARTMLFARDFQVKSADAAAGLTLETEWKTSANGNMVSSTRYLFQGSAPSPETCQVQATAATKNQQGNTSMNRDWRMEWDLLKQVDITSAQRIETDAQAAGEAARNTQG